MQVDLRIIDFARTQLPSSGEHAVDLDCDRGAVLGLQTLVDHLDILLSQVCKAAGNDQ